MIYPRKQAIALIDSLGSRRVPFFFFTDFLGTEAWIKPLVELDPKELSYRFPNQSNMAKTNSSQAVSLKYYPKSLSLFQSQFERVIDEINYGNSFLVNLTLRTPIEIDLSLDEIANLSKAKYTIRYNNKFVCFSPETFVTISGDKIHSFPMKGTIDASLPDAENTIRNNPKEIAEHVTIVDLIRNDLSQVADQVKVTSFRHIDRVKTSQKELLQVSSTIQGNVGKDWNERLGSLLFTLLPAGSITGAPKPKTIQIIQSVEDYDRGFYTGIAGLFDGHSLDSAVMIRFIEQEIDQLVYKSGGGITSFSKMEAEYQEILDKIYVPVY